MASRPAGTGYFVLPDEGEGPGVLVLHAWWGLTPFFRTVCDRLAAEGFVALAPDLHDGRTTDEPATGQALLAEANIDENAALVRSSLFTLRSMPATPEAPVGVLGFSMGASWAMWVSARLPELVAATAVFYGSQNIDFAASRCAYLGHFAEHDAYVTDDEVVLMEAELRLLDKEVEFHHYPGTEHWFFESNRPEFDSTAAERAWERTLTFLHRHLDPH
jgi:carboxymethylenebutenolidase